MWFDVVRNACSQNIGGMLLGGVVRNVVQIIFSFVSLAVQDFLADSGKLLTQTNPEGSAFPVKSTS